MSEVAIISNNKKSAEILSSKILLLRSSDKITIYKFDDAERIVTEVKPDVIIICCTSEKELNLINILKKKEDLNNSAFIICFEDYTPEMLLNAYEYGFDDFIKAESDDAEILTRIMLALQKNKQNNELKKKSRILEELEIIDKNFGIFTKKLLDEIFNKEFEDSVNKNSKTIFMLLAADLPSKKFLPQTFLISIIKKALRKDDIIASDNSYIYILLKDANKAISETVFEKISSSIPVQYGILATATAVVSKEFEPIKKMLLLKMAKQTTEKNGFCFIKQKTDEKKNHTAFTKIKQTDFKLYKQNFLNTFNKITTPLFFQMQTVLQEKLFETTVEQYVNETESKFLLKKDKVISYVFIKYPGYSKIQITIVHQGLINKTEETMIIDRENFSGKLIENILNDLVTIFKKNSEY